MATVQHKRTTVVSIFEIGVSQITKCDNLVRFPRSGHICLKSAVALISHTSRYSPPPSITLQQQLTIETQLGTQLYFDVRFTVISYHQGWGYFAHLFCSQFSYLMVTSCTYMHSYVNCICTSCTVRLIIIKPNILTVLLKYNNLFRSQWQHKTKLLRVAACSLPFYTAIGYFHNNY